MEKKQFIGIDISKLTFNAALYVPGDKSHRIHHSLANTTKGFEAFILFCMRTIFQNRMCIFVWKTQVFTVSAFAVS